MVPMPASLPAALEARSQLGAFQHRALGVELSGLARPADVMLAGELPPRLLAGADDDRIGGDDHLLAVERDMHPGVVDAPVRYALQHPDAVARELRAMHPAGRAPEAVAEGSRRSLEHGDFSFWSRRGNVLQGAVGCDPPVLREGFRFERRAGAML